MGNPYEPHSNLSDYKVKKEVLPDEKTEGLEIPEGNISDLKEWVGDNKDRAELLLEDEISQDSPRKTLVKHLEEVING